MRHKRHNSMCHYNNFSNSPPNRAYINRATGLVATANPEVLNPDNCQEAPCWSKALITQTLHSENQSRVLQVLPTAVVPIEHRGGLFKLRAVIDQGSQRSFIAFRAQVDLKRVPQFTIEIVLGVRRTPPPFHLQPQKISIVMTFTKPQLLDQIMVGMSYDYH